MFLLLALEDFNLLSDVAFSYDTGTVRKSKDSKKAQRSWKQRQRKWYSGSSSNLHGNRKDRVADHPDLSRTIDGHMAVKMLLDAGYMTKPDLCPKCGYGGLHGFVSRPGTKNSGHLYYRCDEWSCRAYTNVIQGCRWLKGRQRFDSINPSRLYLVIQCYTTKQNPRRQDARGLGVPEKVVQFVFDSLRELEVKEAERQMASLRLRGQARFHVLV